MSLAEFEKLEFKILVTRLHDHVRKAVRESRELRLTSRTVSTEENEKNDTPWRGVEPRSRAVSQNDRRVY